MPALWDRHASLLEPTPRAPLTGNATWLVRPDGYVALVTKREDTATIATCLERIAG